MRNVESRFSENPTNIDISRSRFARSSSVKTSFNAGQLIPFYIDEVLPGDTFSVDDSKIIRMSTLLAPIMDNLYLDTYYFFVPNRLVWNHWKEFMGENTQNAWIPQVQYSVPQLTSPSGGWNTGTLADYFGIPTGVGDLSVNALPFRAYSLIVNEWFRDENLTDPIYYSDGDLAVVGTNGSSDTDIPKGGMPFVVAKYHDYFTSCLPAPQKGPDVMLPLGSIAPVVALPDAHTSRVGVAMNMVNPATGNPYSGTGQFLVDSSGNSRRHSSSTDVTSDGYFVPSNLWTALDEATAASINQIRLAFQLQKLYEKDARGGTRYIEILKSHFNVTSPDARLQRPEYLGGSRKPINVTQVVQNSESGNTPQGHTSAYSCTIQSENAFTKSFVEHGFVIGLMCVRYDHTYQQGIERMWSRKGRFDYYWPVFANIGEQAVKNSEIYAQGSTVLNPVTGVAYDDEVFGYNEAWADYRYKPSRTSGMMRSTAATSLDVWHLGDDYQTMPFLSDSWIREDKNNVDRVLAVTSAVSHQFYGDIYIKNVSVRPMPVYSIPGLIDHH